MPRGARRTTVVGSASSWRPESFRQDDRSSVPVRWLLPQAKRGRIWPMRFAEEALAGNGVTRVVVGEGRGQLRAVGGGGDGRGARAAGGSSAPAGLSDPPYGGW